MKTTIEQQAGLILATGRSSAHHLCGLQRSNQVVAGVMGSPQWVAVIGNGGQATFSAAAPTPARAIMLALCYEKIHQQGWG